MIVSLSFVRSAPRPQMWRRRSLRRAKLREMGAIDVIMLAGKTKIMTLYDFPTNLGNLKLLVLKMNKVLKKKTSQVVIYFAIPMRGACVNELTQEIAGKKRPFPRQSWDVEKVV